jgi:hypothetical protein
MEELWELGIKRSCSYMDDDYIQEIKDILLIPMEEWTFNQFDTVKTDIHLELLWEFARIKNIRITKHSHRDLIIRRIYLFYGVRDVYPLRPVHNFKKPIKKRK